jgi:PAS domain S-box-containing protein
VGSASPDMAVPEKGIFEQQVQELRARVAELEQAEAAKEDARLYADSIVETVREPLLVLTSDLRVESANRSFYREFGVSPEETKGRLLYELGSGQWNIPELRQLLEVILPENHSFESFEVDHTFPHIGRQTMLLNARRLSRESSHTGRILLAIENITERRKAEAALEQANIWLRRSNDDLEQFARVASHDLKSPLRTVATFAQLLERKYADKLGNDARQYISLIAGNLAKMQVLIDDLLRYAQVSAASIEPIGTPVSAEEVLQICIANLQGAISETGAQITSDALPLTIAVDATHLLQIFQNLIGNAIHYRSTRPPRIHISATKSEDGGFQFSVRDNGIGIEDQYRSAIFDPFKRLHGQDRPGSGIGLAVCKKILERHAGRIWIESELGQGSTFYFTLPN